jgi:hypothetical protein
MLNFGIPTKNIQIPQKINLRNTKLQLFSPILILIGLFGRGMRQYANKLQLHVDLTFPCVTVWSLIAVCLNFLD